VLVFVRTLDLKRSFIATLETFVNPFNNVTENNFFDRSFAGDKTVVGFWDIATNTN
jgi:hypothetical protein